MELMYNQNQADILNYAKDIPKHNLFFLSVDFLFSLEQPGFDSAFLLVSCIDVFLCVRHLFRVARVVTVIWDFITRTGSLHSWRMPFF